MLEALSLTAATTLAKIVLDKFFDGAGQKLEETATKLGGTVVEKANEKILQLGNLVWQRCFKGKGIDQRLEAAAEGSETDIKVLKDYIDQEIASDEAFANSVKQMAGEIRQVIFENQDISARNVQQVIGGQGLQVNDAQAPVIQAKDSPINITYNNG
ncbi:hypothetical protein Lepto7375DRAFT_6918 [Leptolyngbya sp. PCC 7375]|nr:hypothetical protein Lepto7375DRAFT_6918 [Leptolyngbya sp. PCC 7375]